MFKEYLKVQNNKLTSSVKIPADSAIMEMAGPILLDREIIVTDYSSYLQIGPNTFLGPSGDIGDSLGHSCEPNCRLHVVGNRAILFSLYVIAAGSELNIDYSTTSTDTVGEWSMQCNCGHSKCRRIISGHHYLSDDIKEKYKDNNMFPLYILAPPLITKR